jgi:hypothetical protein
VVSRVLLLEILVARLAGARRVVERLLHEMAAIC